MSAILNRTGNKTKTALGLGLAAALLILPLVIRDEYILRICVRAGIYVLLAVGLNFVAGFTGMLSCAQAAFFGLGAYCSALLSLNLGLSFWVAMPISGLFAGDFRLSPGSAGHPAGPLLPGYGDHRLRGDSGAGLP